MGSDIDVLSFPFPIRFAMRKRFFEFKKNSVESRCECNF